MKMLDLIFQKMRAAFFGGFFLIILVPLFGTSAVKAQNAVGQIENQPKSNESNRQFQKKPSLLSLLDLSIDQKAQLQSINLETKASVRAAAQKQRQARRALDAAVYADVTDQALIDRRLREFNAAQIEASKIRVAIELRIRQILTADQLTRFRDLRLRAEQSMREQSHAPPR